MKATFRLQEVEKMSATLTVTMTLQRWQELRAQLPNKWPSCDLALAIIDLVYQASKHFETRDIVKTGPAEEA